LDSSNSSNYSHREDSWDVNNNKKKSRAAGPPEAQETTGASGNVDNSRDVTNCGDTRNSRDDNYSRDNNWIQRMPMTSNNICNYKFGQALFKLGEINEDEDSAAAHNSFRARNRF
jgi:hypothetical protein